MSEMTAGMASVCKGRAGSVWFGGTVNGMQLMMGQYS